MVNYYSKNLKYIKELLNKTTEQIARDLDIPARTIGGYEREERTPSIDFAIKMQNAYNVNINWLLTNNGAIFNSSNDLKKTKNNIHNRVTSFFHRLKEIQTSNKLLDKELAKILEISEKRYLSISLGKEEPTLKEINNIKTNFNVDIDWLLYGYDNTQYGANSNKIPLPELSVEQYKKLLKLLEE